MKIEICLDSLESAIAAEKGGADRVELCDNLSEGGTTPSAGLIKSCKKYLKNCKVHVIIRPRSGDFFYSSYHFEVMKEDILTAKYLGADGVVFGMLNRDGSIDMKRNRELVQLAHPMSTTFHRAFDFTPDPIDSLEKVISLGFDRVLTSGHKDKVVDSRDLIKKLVEVGDNRITILPGSGLREHNIEQFIKDTNVCELHMTAFGEVESEMEYRKDLPLSSGDKDEYLLKITDENLVNRIVTIAKRTVSR